MAPTELMEKSGQTEAERRRLRQAQRSLQKTIVEQAEAMENPEEDVFGQVREQNNELWGKVAYTREAVLDGENLHMISERAARQVDALVQVPRYDPLRFVQKLRSKCCVKQRGGGSYFDWNTLGVEAGSCYNAIPARVQFLAGPLEADYTPKERKPRAKRTQDSESEAEEERPDEIKNQETNADQLSAVERNIKTLSKTLRKRSREVFLAEKERIDSLPEQEQEAERKRVKSCIGEIDAVQYLFNPKSFTQTVENIFHFSFLVKKGGASIAVKDEKPMVAYKKEKEGADPPSRQAIVALTMKDWKELCEAYHVKKCDIPHRTGSKHFAARNTSDD